MSLAKSQRFRWWPHGATKKGVFFDFDQTLTTAIKLPRFQRHAVADRPDIFANMTAEEVVSNFGGRQRIARLASLFSTLEDAGAELFIVSIGLRDSCILPHLRAVGLADFFDADNVFGQDSEALRSRALCKGRLVAALMAERGWEPDEALFIDDSARHIEATAGVCEVLKVAGRGLSDAELEAISVISQDSNVAKYGSKSPLANGSGWRLQVDEGVPAAKVAISVVCGGQQRETSSDSFRLTIDHTPYDEVNTKANCITKLITIQWFPPTSGIIAGGSRLPTSSGNGHPLCQERATATGGIADGLQEVSGAVSNPPVKTFNVG